MSSRGGLFVRHRLVLAGCMAAACAVAASAPLAWGTTMATVRVNATQGVAGVPAAAIGINGSVYDRHLTDPAVPSLLRAAGVTMIRFPGRQPA
ncbi:MAG TPA: hypothetical protein VGD84_07380, partial [Pseudonocardiaceae bacterium]